MRRAFSEARLITGRMATGFYEEAQLLMLQQILFYRELGLELK